MYPTRLYLFWNTIPILKIPSNCGCHITEYNLFNWTRQNRPYANLTFKNLQNAQNPQKTFFTFCWCTPLSTHPSTLLSHLQVHSQEGSHSDSNLTILSNVYSCMMDPETSWVEGTRHREAWDRWQVMGAGLHMVADIMTSVKIIFWILSSAQPPWRDITIPHDHIVDICSLRFCRNGRQMDIG
jgi:hypothetical protein